MSKGQKALPVLHICFSRDLTQCWRYNRYLTKPADWRLTHLPKWDTHNSQNTFTSLPEWLCQASREGQGAGFLDPRPKLLWESGPSNIVVQSININPYQIASLPGRYKTFSCSLKNKHNFNPWSTDTGCPIFPHQSFQDLTQCLSGPTNLPSSRGT